MTTNINTKEYWNANYASGFYQDHITNDHAIWTDFITKVLPQKKCKVLEVACGLANNSVHVAKLGHAVIATDFSKVAIEENVKRFSDIKNLMFVECEAFEALERWRECDVIMAFETLEHFSDPLKLIRAIHKGLKEEGMFVFSVPYETGRFGVFEQHLTLWNYDSSTMRMFKVFKEVRFFRNEALGQNIMGVAIK